jgi:hypothetical protein
MANVKLGNKIYENVETVKLDTADGGTVEFADRDAAVEAGKQEAYDKFWDMFQENGNMGNCTALFAGVGWTDETYNPKYPIVATNNAGELFRYSKITSTKVPITIDNTGSNYGVFLGAYSLKTITSLKVAERLTSFEAWFSGTSSLVEINFTEDSVIKADISFAVSTKLNTTSVDSIIHALKDLTGAAAQTLTFHATVGANLTEEQKAAITAKNWTLVY